MVKRGAKGRPKSCSVHSDTCSFSPRNAHRQEKHDEKAKQGGHKLDCGMAATVLNLRGGADIERPERGRPRTEQLKALRDFLNDDDNLRIKV